MLRKVQHIALATGRFRRESVFTETVTMTDSPQTLSLEDIPSYGDIVGFIIKLTQSTTGTLVTPNPIDRAIRSFKIFDVKSESIWANIAGSDLNILCTKLGPGRAQTVPDTANSANSHEFYIPWNIEVKDQLARIEVQIAAYTDMAASGETGGSVTIQVVALYVKESKMGYTQRLTKLPQTVTGAGVDRFNAKIPRGQVIEHTFFTVGTESNVNSLNFSANGDGELNDIALNEMEALENMLDVSGHQTGEFFLPHHPYNASSKTVLQVDFAGVDTINWYFIGAK